MGEKSSQMEQARIFPRHILIYPDNYDTNYMLHGAHIDFEKYD
jgi:hypothetical protein